MQGAMLVSWGAPARGREAKGLEVFGKALQMFEDHAKAGRIHGHREYFCITGNNSERAGFMVVDGEIEELQKILVSDDNLRLMTEASAITDNFEVTLCAGGSDQSVGEMVSRFTETNTALGYM